MNSMILLITMVIMWIIVIASSYQRLYTMPGWFSNPPASFERIRRQSRASQAFWLPITALSLILNIASLINYWYNINVRIYLLAGFLCFVMNGVSTGAYFVKEILIFAKMSPDVPSSPGLLKRTKSWLRWTTLRNILQLLSAIFVSIAYQLTSR